MSAQELDRGENSGKKEQGGVTFFDVRFGFGPHTINARHSDWVNELAGDVGSFFMRSDSPQRNIFYFEDATGSQSFLETLRKAYRHYNSYATAYVYASLHVNRMGKDFYPPVPKLTEAFEHTASSGALGNVRMVDGARFQLNVLSVLDTIVVDKGIPIEISTETRKDQAERKRVSDLIEILSSRISSPEGLQEFVRASWNLNKLRDSKVVNDLFNYYRRASKQKVPTKVYVSMGEDHSRQRTLLEDKLRNYSNFRISGLQGFFYQSLESATNWFETAISLVASGSDVSPEQWNELFKEMEASNITLTQT